MSILNLHTDEIPADTIYIGRGSRWGNPFVIGVDGNRDQVCEKHEEWVVDRILDGSYQPEELAKLHEKHLLCYCAPERCHGETLKKYAEVAVKYLEKRNT